MYWVHMEESVVHGYGLDGKFGWCKSFLWSLSWFCAGFKDCKVVWFVGYLSVLILLSEALISTLAFDLVKRDLPTKCQSYISVMLSVNTTGISFWSFEGNHCLDQLFWLSVRITLLYDFNLFFLHCGNDTFSFLNSTNLGEMADMNSWVVTKWPFTVE